MTRALRVPNTAAPTPWWAPLGGVIGAFAVVAGLLFVNTVGAGTYAGLPSRPGNVRELRHVLERACVMSSAEILDADDFELGGVEVIALPASELDLRRNLESLERQLIQEALARANGNRAEAARLLGIRRALLYARARALGLVIDGPPKS
jgi:DNA-binding protein Fis